MRPATDDDDVWVRAQAVLDRTLPEPTDLQASRERYDRRLTRIAVVLTGGAAALALLAPLLAPGDESSTGRVVTALTVAGLALLLMTVGPWKRPGGSSRELTRPLEWLTRRQRGELTRYVRSRQVEPTRLALTRLQAVAMIEGRVDLVPQAGHVSGVLGLSILGDSWPLTVTALALAAAVAVMALVQSRDGRLARRFLDEHPAAEDTTA